MAPIRQKKSNLKKSKSKDKRRTKNDDEEENEEESSANEKSNSKMSRPKKKTPKKGKGKKTRTCAEPESNSKDIIKDFQKRGTYTDLDYWHGLLPHEDTGALLKEDGQFMIRRRMEAEQDGPILISVRSGDQILNTVITENENGFQVCDREFESMVDLVDYYQVRKMPLTINQQSVILGNPVRRKPWELRQSMVNPVKVLGSGSYGEVFLGHLTLPRQKPIEVAIKFLTEMNNVAAAELWKEARVMQEFKHPNTVKIYGVANDSHPFMMVMELVKGGSVESFLQKNASINLAKRTRIALEAAEGLEYLHSMGCIHRDVAARNLLIDKVTKVADFGMTRKSKEYKIDPEKPLNLRWMAPDVFESTIVTKATDVYAYGVTLYELYKVPYAVPYDKWEPEEVFDRVVNKGFRLAPPQLLPRELAGIMRECLMEPKMRPTFKMIVIYLAAQLKLIEQKGGGEYDATIPKRIKKAQGTKKSKTTSKMDEEDEE